MNIILHDLGNHLTFAPLTLTRPVGNLRTGMWTNDERWKFYCPTATISYQTEEYLSQNFPKNQAPKSIWVNAALVPTQSVIGLVLDLKEGETLYKEDVFIAFRGRDFSPSKSKSKYVKSAIILKDRWDLFKKNEAILKEDFKAYTKERKSEDLSVTNTLIGDKSQLFIEKGAKIEGVSLNVTTGPIYVGKDAEIMENTAVRGGLAMAKGSVLKMAAKLYGAISLGPYCKVGGEVNNSIFQGYSNKGHDGFIGNSLIGEWCNLGADTNCSNLKNNYGQIKAYNYKTKKFQETKEQFMGLTMGDFSKTSINMMLNTATVIGVAVNLFSTGFPPKYIPNFSWGGEKDAPVYDFKKMCRAADAMMRRRGKKLSPEEKEKLLFLYHKK